VIPTFLNRKRVVYSYTNLNTYANVCPHQFYRRYLAKDISYVETDAMKRGNDVHSAMEHRVCGDRPLPPDMQQWEPLVAPLAAKRSQFDRERTGVAQDLSPCVDNEQDILDRQHNAVRSSVQVELKLGINQAGEACDFWAGDVWLRGKLDVVIMVGDAAHLIDWKTGNPAYENSLELEIGALLLRAACPHLLRLSGCYVWLRENRLGNRYDLSNIESTLSIVRAIAADIEAGKFEKVPGPLCGYCDVRDCEYNKKR